MALFNVFWESWEQGCEEIEAATEDEARRLWEKKVGSLEPTGEGIDITNVEEVDHEEADEEPDDDAHGRPAQDEELAAMVVSALTGVEGGMTLPDLAAKVLKMGYKPQSNNLGQAIYNILRRLKREGKVAKDFEAKKYLPLYRLVPVE